MENTMRLYRQHHGELQQLDDDKRHWIALKGDCTPRHKALYAWAQADLPGFHLLGSDGCNHYYAVSPKCEAAFLPEEADKPSFRSIDGHKGWEKKVT